MHKRKSFKSHVVYVRASMFKPLLYLLICFFLTSFLLSTGLSLPTLRSDVLLHALSHTFLPIAEQTEKTLYLTPYDILSSSVISIKASEAMSKKYAAKYGGVFKKMDLIKQSAPLNDGNIVEADASVSTLSFINTPQYPVDAEALLNTPLLFVSKNKDPRVLIVHTHTSEAYSESEGARNDDPNYNVVSVGKAIKDALQKNGIIAIHDTTQNDNPSYNQSYQKAMTVIQENLKRNPTIEVVLDIHRDYIKRDDGTLLKPTIMTRSGQKAAQIMFVIGTDAMGLSHPDWKHNLCFAVKIQNHLNQEQPGLCRAINIRTERFNQHATKGSMIIEVGTGVNSVDEARLAGSLVGNSIGKILKQNEG